MSLAADIGPSIANHLWQSTAFAAVCGLASLVLRKNPARVRYGLWLAASLKFLIPFSLLVSLGGQLPRTRQIPIKSQAAVYSAIDTASVPFRTSLSVSSSQEYSHSPGRATRLLPQMLFVLWALGTVFVTLIWCRRWRQLSANLRNAMILKEGRELEILRRLEDNLVQSNSIPIIRTRSMMEPGIFGIFSPVMLWPEGLSGQLSDDQIKAILAHELAHARRHDNLAALLHMLVEAAFWFHPIVWWIESRIVEEQEHACDEAAVLEVGSSDIYAESLLKACRFCLESPLTCVPGIAGGNLRRRILRITDNRLLQKLDFKRQALLCFVAFVSLAVPVLMGAAHASQNGTAGSASKDDQTQPGASAVSEKAPLGSMLHAQDARNDLSGNWQGTLQAGQGLRFVMKVRNDDGMLKAVSYSLDQGGQPIAITSISLRGMAVNFTIKPLDVAYVGTLSPDSKSISGNLAHGGENYQLNLQRVSEENTWALPEPLKSMPTDAKPKWEVGTVKPSDPSRPGPLFTVRGSHVMTIGTDVNDLISFAYGLHSKQIVDAPVWLSSEKFDIDGVPDVEGQPSSAQLKMVIQSLLVERFKLTFHHEQRELSVYALTIAMGGPKMTVTANNPNDHRDFLFQGHGNLTVTNSTMKDFCDGMQAAVMDKPMVDHTGLTDRFDFHLKWTPDESQFEQLGFSGSGATEDANSPPNLQTALQEQVGLKLEPAKAAANVIVIDYIEKPSAN
jgi:uncharacterized protein (TIGR03435 family)